MNLKPYLLLMLLLCPAAGMHAQCSAGLTEVAIKVITTNRGYEAYWQLVPDTNLCGNSTIFSGGNTAQMNCNGANANVATPGNGYANFDTITEGPWCLTEGGTYSIRFVDDSGVSENHFVVLINGFPVYNFVTLDVEQLFTFTVHAPLDWNMGLKKIKTINYQNPGAVTVRGRWFNYSTNTITSMDVNYSVDNGPVEKQTLNGLSIAPFTQIELDHPTLWNISANGTYSLKLWADNLNGNNDMDNLNDTVVKTIVAGDSIPNIIDQYLTIVPVFTVVGDSSDQLFMPSDLDFHTILSNNELWVLNRATVAAGGSTVTFYHAGQPNQVSLFRQDLNFNHFMLIPSGIAFSDNTNFATSSGILDAHLAGGHYAGPTLWSSDSLIYAQPGVGPLGSHIDMLHQSPYSMGIAAEHDNAFWVHDGYNERLTWYDFVEDHGPGFDDHTDGLIRRYDDIILNRIDDVIPSHLVLNKDGLLYIVDNGNARVMRMDTHTGTVTGDFVPYAEFVAEHSVVTGVTWSDYITTGLAQPAGIDVIGDRLIVSDFSNGDIIIYDITGAQGVELGRLHTGAAGVAGVKIGPDGKIWFVNMLQNKLYRIDGTTVVINESNSAPDFNVYPNPVTNNLIVETGSFIDGIINIYDATGRKVYSESTSGKRAVSMDLSKLPSGVYNVMLHAGDFASSGKRIVKR